MAWKTAWRRLRRPARELLRAAFDLVLPPVCPGCREPAAEGLCGRCDQDLVRRPWPGCTRCGEPVLTAGSSCGRDHAHLPHVAHLVAPFAYAGTGGALVRRFKLDGDVGAGRWLTRAMADAWRRQVGNAWARPVLVPVPLHAARARRRGFDQAAWLAREVGERLGWRVACGALRRVRATMPQGDPRVTSRAANVEGAFAVRHPAALQEQRVVLVDDVFTSGATARECAQLVRSAGARVVAVLTACRS